MFSCCLAGGAAPSAPPHQLNNRDQEQKQPFLSSSTTHKPVASFRLQALLLIEKVQTCIMLNPHPGWNYHIFLFFYFSNHHAPHSTTPGMELSHFLYFFIFPTTTHHTPPHPESDLFNFLFFYFPSHNAPRSTTHGISRIFRISRISGITEHLGRLDHLAQT